MDRGLNFALGSGEKSNEVATQKSREADKFTYYARGDSQIPSNPLRELDELYSKDAKVPHIDLEGFAKDHLKHVEEKKFNDDMAQLQQELDKLEPGKYSSPQHPSLRHVPPHTTTAIPSSSTLRILKSPQLVLTNTTLAEATA